MSPTWPRGEEPHSSSRELPGSELPMGCLAAISKFLVFTLKDSRKGLNSVGSGQELFIEDLKPVTSPETLGNLNKASWASCDVSKCTQTHRSILVSDLFFFF